MESVLKRPVMVTGKASPSAASASGNTADAAGPDAAARRRLQNLLLLASIGMLVGSFLPWIETAVGSYRGFASVGRFTFYFAWIGLAGALIPFRRLAGIQAGIMAAAGLGFPIWQCLHLFDKVGLQGWVPGTGMMIMVASAALALRSAVGLLID